MGPRGGARQPGRRARCTGVITLEDIIESILTEQVYDETDREQALATVAPTLLGFMQNVVRPKMEERREASPPKPPSRAPSGSLLVRPRLDKSNSLSERQMLLLRGKALPAADQAADTVPADDGTKTTPLLSAAGAGSSGV